MLEIQRLAFICNLFLRFIFQSEGVFLGASFLQKYATKSAGRGPQKSNLKYFIQLQIHLRFHILSLLFLSYNSCYNFLIVL